MATQAEKINQLDIRISQVAGELRFNETMVIRTDALVQDIAELSYEHKARADVLDERMISMMDALKHNHEDIESLRRDAIKADTQVINEIKALEMRAAVRFDKLGKRLQRLEAYRWYLAGGILVIAFFASMADFSKLFG